MSWALGSMTFWFFCIFEICYDVFYELRLAYILIISPDTNLLPYILNKLEIGLKITRDATVSKIHEK